VEESLSHALLAAGERLADALRRGLSEYGLPSEIHIVLDGDRVIVASRSAELRRHEVGQAGYPPGAIMEGIARDAVPEVLQAFVERLGGTTL
jgi:hypothetical protein